MFLFLLFAATYPESKLVQIWNCFSPGHAPILLPCSSNLAIRKVPLGMVRITNSQQFPSRKVNHWIRGFLRDYFSMNILFIWSLPVLPHGPCLLLTLVLTQGQEDKARCVRRSPGDPHTAGVWSSICQGGHSSYQMPGLGYRLC